MPDEPTFPGVVVDARMIVANSGNEAIVITFDIEGKGKMKWTGYWHTESSRAFTERTLKKLGFDLKARNHDLDACCKEILGRKALCVIESHEYNGKKEWRVKYIEWPGSKDLSPEEVQKLSERLRKPPPEELEGPVPF